MNQNVCVDCETIGNLLNTYHLGATISDKMVEEFRVDAGSSAGFLINKRQKLAFSFPFECVGV